MSASSQSDEGENAPFDGGAADEPLVAVGAPACVLASHAATGLRLTLPVEVRGRSGSGHTTHRLMR